MKPLTYREAGVDIDAGDDAVRRITPLARATNRAEVIGGVGGFASLVGLPSKYREPVMVSSTDGVGSKLKIACLDRPSRHGGHRPGRHGRQRHPRARRRAALLPRLHLRRPARSRADRIDRRRRRRGLPAGRLRAGRRRDGRAPGLAPARRVRSRRLRGRHRRAAAIDRRLEDPSGRRRAGAGLVRPALQRLQPGPADRVRRHEASRHRSAAREPDVSWRTSCSSRREFTFDRFRPYSRRSR